MDSKERFSNRVDSYVKYRPGYPKEAIDYLYDIVVCNRHPTALNLDIPITIP